ncbi:putative competence-damage inducible protein [Pseudobythopirellula maris]|uniref:CinA-like protein n=1 Tax=Pseudobythopirellula maris TaxID=2527991 RepID=A0A5C5ZWF9_9BACT|nr:CinA family nicotinamide mononucleotide deamidase-related protein [Pseudobythopirellula maris]TWT90593.1 putative competence-damage inducible protein [Pseudobythopirellula maris]
MPLRAEIIAIGDELTSGQRLDTNTQWLSERLGELGVEVAFHTTVGDSLEDHVAILRAAFERADVVVTTGGLGPTADDLTRDALAKAVGAALVEDPVALAHIERMFASRGRTMPANNRLQALFPHGSRQIPNAHGTAPGIDMAVRSADGNKSRVFCLPGVPAEMHEMWSATVRGAVAAMAPEARVLVTRKLKCFGVGESRLEEMLPDLIRRGREPRVGVTASGATLTLRVTAGGPDEAACLAVIEPTLDVIHQSLGMLVFGAEDDELQHAVVRLLGERGETIVSVEAATSGLLSHWLAEADEAGAVYRSGEFLPTHGDCTTEEWALNAAEAKRVAMGVDYALAIGSPNAADDPTVPVAMASAAGGKARSVSTLGQPAILKARLAKTALNLLRLRLLGSSELE